MPGPVQADARGSLELLVLETRSLAPMHGWGIGQRIDQISSGAPDVRQGSLYPALQRLEHKGLITSDWQLTHNNLRARICRISALERRALGDETASWKAFVAAMDLVLRAT